MVQKQVSVRLKADGAGQVKAEFQSVGAQAQRSFGQVDRSARGTGQGLQNVGFQVQDFAVQVAGGTDASRALAQQLPQLLSGFGLLGVLLGTAAAVAIPLFSSFGIGRDKSAELTTSVNALTEAMKEYEAASKAAAQSPVDLFGNFGGGAAQAQQVLEIQRQIAAVRAENALDQASGSIASFLGSDAGRIEAYREQIRLLREEAQAAQSNPMLAVDFDFATAEANIAKLQGRLDRMNAEVVEGLASSLSVGTDAAARIVDALGAVAEASDAAPRAQADAMGALRDAIVDAVAAGGDFNEEALQLLQSLSDAELAALGLASVDLSSTIGAAADEAGRLAQNLSAAASREYGKIMNTGEGGADAARRSVLALNAPGLMTGTLASGAGGVFVPPPAARRGGGGGGAGNAQNEMEREAARVYDQTRTAAEKLVIEETRLNELRDAGAIDTETYTRAIAKLGDGLDRTADLGKRAASAIRGAFDNLFDDPAAALRGLASQLAQMALMQQLSRSLPGIFGSGGFLPLMNANGNAFDRGMVQAFANGGVVSGATMFPMRGGMGMMGEAGPEAIMPLTRIGGKLGVAAAGGGGGTKVEIYNQSGGEVTTETRRGPNGEELIKVLVAKQMANGSYDGSMRSRFGNNPTSVKR